MKSKVFQTKNAYRAVHFASHNPMTQLNVSDYSIKLSMKTYDCKLVTLYGIFAPRIRLKSMVFVPFESLNFMRFIDGDITYGLRNFLISIEKGLVDSCMTVIFY